MIMVESSGAVVNLEYKISQEQRMEQSNGICNILQLIFQNIFVCLRDVSEIIQKELSSLFEKSEEILEPELNDYSFPFSKQAIADFLAFYIICAVLGIFIIVTSRNNRVPEPCIDFTPSPSPEINVPLVDLTEEETPDQDSLYELPNIAHPWGDSIAEPEQTLPQRIYFYQPKSRPYCRSIDTLSRQSHISVRSTPSHQFQTTRAKDQIYQRQPEPDWLIRRTRSGQIYGKYPVS